MGEKMLLHVEDVTMAYRESAVLWDIDLDVPTGVRCAIVGPNGAGKSTLLKGVLGLEKPVAGYVRLWGKTIDEVRERIAYVPQRGAVNWDFPTTVFDVVLMGRYVHIGLMRRPGREDRERARAALAEMQLEKLAERQISELSGGQKQRVFIARALAQESDLYIMDEPLAGVDETTERIVMDKFVALQKARKTVIAVHHDLSTLDMYFDYLVVLNRTIKASGYLKDMDKEAALALAFRPKER
ncbi:MAG: metal ABC transporter ATP-binding protein [Selenomonas sp.]|uniref:ABC transporter, ATP-binding protein n=1 Tax=Selenomonas sputigena (strain ATCC 35185 / DSM 20758 / CCUG 44933 / VPI D19B-28) TaxID=546271 RepID=C9LYC0_SELS3|nr:MULTISPECIES: ABC transporter ATP-binding protein [Selenomonas]AEB99214.1 Phosphonate-transporting ATPase [Selenomonas sputigena ATCC 35185]EEX76150.1 ABC transporter, ATP-binding protein [Selenomonas sputigena ATCC 35185]EJU25586.1 ABC transporter, ATP-binding protein [Selenomonas sp. CM52]